MDEITVIYLRLSKEDEFVKDESNSITNQRILLNQFIESHEQLRDTKVVEIKDDGYSGKNMERPGMTRLLELIRKQQVKNIIVKDFSRFSRDYLTLGKYVEQIFPFMGIRFIAVNEGYDSASVSGGIGEIDVAMKGLLYDFYSEDLSVKVKSSLKNKRDSGKYVATFAPYGYRKSEDDKYKLVIDPEAAEIVRRIYDEYCQGISMYEIASRRNKENVLSPGIYIAQRDGRKLNTSGRDKSRWNVNAVRRILHNDTYGGDILYNKLPEAEVGKRATTTKPEEEWSRIENAHEAIVDKRTFDAVRAKLPKKTRAKADYEKPALNGLVFCKNCGFAMAYNPKGRKRFCCMHRYNIGDEDAKKNCVTSIRVDDLNEVVMNLLQDKLRKLEDRKQLAMQERAKLELQKSSARNELASMEKALESLNEEIVTAYEAYRDGFTSREIFLSQRQNIEASMEKLKGKIKIQEEKISKMENENHLFPAWYEEDETLKLSKLDKELARMLIEKITVNAENEIEIYWKFKM